jgi:hypothetical protein
MRGIFTALTRGMWMNMLCRRLARIRPLVRRLMLAVRTTVSTIMGLVVDMRRYRTAVIPTTSSKATCIIRIKGTATITVLSLWLDDFGTREAVDGRL